MDSLFRKTHYQTSFILDSDRTSELFQTILKKIWQWILRKERSVCTEDGRVIAHFPLSKRGMEVFLTDDGFQNFSKGRFSAKIGCKGSVIKTLTCDLDDRLLWGMEYGETRVTFDWLTEIGMTVFKEGNAKRRGVVFYIRVSYSPKDAFAKDPSVNVPGLIRDLIAPKRGEGMKAHGTNSPFVFNPKPLRVAEEKMAGRQFADFLFSPSRRYPVFVVAADRKSQTKQLQTLLTNLCSKLLGKILVFWINPASIAYQVMWGRIHLNVNTLYLLRPSSDGGESPETEEYGLVDFEELQERLECHINRQRPVMELDAVTPSDVAWARQRDLEHKRYLAELAGKAEEVERIRQEKENEWAEWMKGEDDFIAQKDHTIASLTHEKNKLVTENNSLRHKLLGLTKKESESTQEEEEYKLGKIVTSMYSVIGKRTLKEQVRGCKYLFEDRMVLTDKALKALDDPPSGFGFKQVMEFLVPLYTRLYPSYVSPSIGCRREDLLKDLPIDYTANENTLTMDTEKFRRDRTVTYNGSEYVCEEHLKMTKGDARLYFVYSEKEKKIIICHIGKHLDTAGTKKRGH